MADTPTPSSDTVPVAAPVVVKKYANRRLYNTETSSYITLDNLAEMIRAGRDFVVYDAKSGEDITRGVLTQIIVEEESKGSSMLPTTFLRQLIGFYGDSLQGVVPRYLEQAMSNFARQQQQMRQVMQQTFSPFLPMGVPMSVEEMGRQNLALMERAMSMFNPFHRPGEHAPRTADHEPGPVSHPGAEMEALRQEVESLRAQLASARAETAAPPPAPRQEAVPVANQAPDAAPDTAPNAEHEAAVAPAPSPAKELAPRKAPVGGPQPLAASTTAFNVVADPPVVQPIPLPRPKARVARRPD